MGKEASTPLRFWRSLSVQSRRLLVVMGLVSTAIFMVTPFMIVHLAREAALASSQVGAAIMTGMVVGNSLAFALSLRLPLTSLVRVNVVALVGLCVAMAALGGAGMVGPVAAFWLIIAALIVFRLAVGLYFNCTRSIHLSSNDESVSPSTLLAVIKVISSGGGALGPLLGALILGVGSFRLLAVSAAALVAVAASIAVLLVPALGSKPVPRSGTVPSTAAPQRNWHLGAVPWICLGAFFHYILEAQIFSFVTLRVEAVFGAAGNGVVTTVFAVNAVVLVVATVPFLQLAERVLNNAGLRFTVGSLASAAAIAGFGALKPSVVQAIILAALFTIGEIVAPQVSLELVNEATPDKRHISRNVALFNLASSALGLGAGQLLGAVTVEWLPAASWPFVWIAVAMLAGLSTIKGVREFNSERTMRQAR